MQSMYLTTSLNQYTENGRSDTPVASDKNTAWAENEFLQNEVSSFSNPWEQSIPSSEATGVSLLPFVPTYDADGNATVIQTSTGTWIISYNGENRPIRFENAETQTVVECGYDSQGRRFEKKVTVAGTVTLHHRYIYRGYLQIACVDCARSGHPALWFVTWDPSQATATRPLAIQKDGTWFTYGLLSAAASESAWVSLQ